MSELVREIVEVAAFLSGDDEHPLLTVEAEGVAATAGWSHVRLEPHVYITPPEDGMQDFDLVGDRPAGGAGEALTAVEAMWEGPIEDWLLGVRVHAVDNMIEDEVFEPWDEDDDDADDDEDLDDEGDEDENERGVRDNEDA